MSTNNFQILYDGLCQSLQVPTFKLPDTGDGPVAFHLDRQGVVVDVLYFPHTCPGYVHVLFEFGAIPYDDPRVSHIVLALLDINFLLPQPHPPALGRNPVTGDVVMRCVYPLEGMESGDLLELIDQGAALALEWRQDYFLNEAAVGARHRSDAALAVPVGGLA